MLHMVEDLNRLIDVPKVANPCSDPEEPKRIHYISVILFGGEFSDC